MRALHMELYVEGCLYNLCMISIGQPVIGILVENCHIDLAVNDVTCICRRLLAPAPVRAKHHMRVLGECIDCLHVVALYKVGMEMCLALLLESLLPNKV